MDYKCKAIHETVIRDILDVVDTIKDNDCDLFPGIANKKSFKSIAAASSNLTLVFPVICTRSLNIENASMISKAIERKAVSMLQMLFSAMCISDSDDGMEYIKQFHTNLKIDDTITVDSFINAMDDLVVSKESALKVRNKEMYDAIKEDLQNLNFYLPNNIEESSLNDYMVSNSVTVTNEANGGHGRGHGRGQRITIDLVGRGAINLRNRDSENGARGSMSAKDYTNYLQNQLLDNDVKKCNELVPTTMIVNFVSTNGDDHINTQIVIGVKAKLYPVDSMDIINRLIIKHKDRNTLMQFVRSTTREISFVRDFIFAIDRAKIDALSQSNKGSSSKLWKILERRALKSKIRRGLGQINDASAISTLVVTQEEVEYMKKEYNVDIERPEIIRPIMESMNFMGVVIVDETSEIAKFIFDTGNDIYEHLSFRNLERESSSNDYKKIVSLMSKMR